MRTFTTLFSLTIAVLFSHATSCLAADVTASADPAPKKSAKLTPSQKIIALQDQLKKTQEENRILKVQNSSLSDALRRARQTTENLHTKVNNQKLEIAKNAHEDIAQVKKIKSLSAEVSRLKDKLKSSNSEKLKAENAKLTAKNKMLADKNKILVKNQPAAVAQLIKKLDSAELAQEKLQAEITKLRTAKNKLQNDLASNSAMTSKLQREIRDLHNKQTISSNNISSLVDKLFKIETKLTKIRKQYSRSQNTIQTQNDTIARLRAKLQILKENAHKVSPDTDSSSDKQNPDTAKPHMKAAISEKIIATKGKLILIGAGFNKGLKKGSIYYVYRGAKLIGKVRIDEVDVKKSAGKMLTDKILPRKGDIVKNIPTQSPDSVK